MGDKTHLKPQIQTPTQSNPKLTGLGWGSRLGCKLGGGWLRALSCGRRRRRLLLRLGLLLRCRSSGQKLRGIVVVVGAQEFKGIEGRHVDGGGKGHPTVAFLYVGTGELTLLATTSACRTASPSLC